jgi:hypothetical protein
MSGAVAAHAAYNGAGTQGLAVTNKINDTGDVMSVFWNKNDTTRQLLHGSNFVEVPSQGTSGGASKSIISFDINNDVDCIGDIILEVTATLNIAAGRTELPFLRGGRDLLNAISRVDFIVGTQIWQTLEYDDILALYHSEMSEGGFGNISFQLRGHYSGADTDRLRFVPEIGIVASTTEYFVANIPLKMLSKTIASQLELFSEHTEDGYLMAAAPNQQVRINVSTNTPTDVDTNCGAINVRLFSKNIVMCESERQQLSATRIAKRIKVTQNAIYRPVTTEKSFTIILDHFSIYASHIVIVTSIPYYRLDTAELLLNSSSFSGEVPFSLLRVTGASMGLFSNYSENLVGSDRKGYYIFPLASTAYSGSSIPLNRFDNIRLIIKTYNGFQANAAPEDHTASITAVGCTTALYANGAASISMY